MLEFDSSYILIADKTLLFDDKCVEIENRPLEFSVCSLKKKKSSLSAKKEISRDDEFDQVSKTLNPSF